MKKNLLAGFLLVFFTLSMSAQDSLFIYRNGQIIYSSQVDQIDSAAFHPPSYWGEKRSEIVFASIQTQPELRIFASMLEQAGYKTKLDKKTIWAPVNAALAEIDLNDSLLVRKLVENHISEGLYYQYPALLSTSKVTMINHKCMDLKKTGDDYFLDGNKILTLGSNKLSGLINSIDGYIPIRPTLLEYLNETSSADSMRTYLHSYNKRTFDTVTKDSVITNELLTNVKATLNLESVEYTVLIPNDQLWNKTIDYLMQFYTPTTDTVLKTSRLDNVKRIILKDLFIQDRRSSLSNDTLLLTTLGNDLNNPAQFFGNDSLLEKLSNGNCLRISKLDHLNKLVEEVRVEAEYPNNRSSYNSRLTTIPKTSTPDVSISNNAYLDIYPLTTSSIQKVWVQYSIPNLLPGKYNIYVVFVPTYVEDSTKVLPYLVNFYLTYPDSNGITLSTTVSTNVVTLPKTISKILVKSNFEVNFFDMGLAGATNPLIKVKVENAARSNQETLYTREIRTDCILFEPVQ